MQNIVIKYIIKAAKFLWKNKVSVSFVFISIMLLCMYGCQKYENEKLTKEINAIKAENEICKNQKEIALNCNTDLEKGLEICKKELQITKESYKEAETIKEQFDAEIAKYKQIASAIDNEKDSDKALEMKKELIEELFKGKSDQQIIQLRQKIINKIQIKTNIIETSIKR